MAVKLNIEYDQLLELARQLPLKQQKKLIEDLGEQPVNGEINTTHSDKQKNWEEILSNFPVATEEDLKGYEEARTYVNQWLKK